MEKSSAPTVRGYSKSLLLWVRTAAAPVPKIIRTELLRLCAFARNFFRLHVVAGYAQGFCQ